MGIKSFEKEDCEVEAKVERPEIDDTKEKARPYVSREVHEKVNLFSANSGLPMQVTYDTLLDKAVTNTNILELILTSESQYSDNLSDSEAELLNDLFKKSKELGRFPTRKEINRDSSLSGFPVYITHLGSRQRIKRLIRQNFSSEISFDLDP